MAQIGDPASDFADAILSAFPTEDEINPLLRISIEKELDWVARTDSLKTALQKLYYRADEAGYLEVILHEAVRQQPNNTVLKSYLMMRSLFLIVRRIRIPGSDLARIVGMSIDFQSEHILINSPMMLWNFLRILNGPSLNFSGDTEKLIVFTERLALHQSATAYKKILREWSDNAGKISGYDPGYVAQVRAAVEKEYKEFAEVRSLQNSQNILAFDGGEPPIIVNILTGQAEVEVGQTAVFELEIINAGPLVASFQVALQGLPEGWEEWVEVTPAILNLNEKQRATVRIKATPPRSPSSLAGVHQLRIIVSSNNYRGQQIRTGLTLTIRPYYEFNVGSLMPRPLRISWRKRSGAVKLIVTNQSNTAADFNVSAYDAEDNFSFDFQVSEGVERNRQVMVNILAGRSVPLPIKIAALKHPVVALRSREYHYTTTVQLLQQSVMPQMVSGSVTSIPLIGWWAMMLIAPLLLAGLFLLLQPNIYSYQVAAGKDVIELGDTSGLEWAVSPFATRLSISNVDKAIPYGLTSLTVAPTQSTNYELVAGNWLSGLLGLDQKNVQTIFVVPPSPKINTFEVDSTRVYQGAPVTVRWSVTQATKAFLTIDQVVYELTPDKFSGEQSFVMENDTLVTLEVQNAGKSELRSYYINVVPPNITVRKFLVWAKDLGASNSAPSAIRPNISLVALHAAAQTENPPDPNFPVKYVELVPDPGSNNGYVAMLYQPDRVLSKGEQVMVEWEVEGVEQLHIAPFTEQLPNKGVQPFFPQASMNFVMTARSGDLEMLYMLPVKVFDGPPPSAPTIDFFKATPETMKAAGDVTFSWSVSGDWTRMQLASAGGVIDDYLPPQGFKKVHVTQSGTYILTAWNGKLSKAQYIVIIVNN